MQYSEYQHVSNGLIEELGALALPEVLEHFDNYLKQFLLDSSISIVYINRMANDRELSIYDKGFAVLKYILLKYNQLAPFDLDGLNLCIMLNKSAEHQTLVKYIQSRNGNNKWEAKVDSLLDAGEPQIAIQVMQNVLSHYPDNLHLADRLLFLLQRQGQLPDRQFDGFKIASPFALAWKRRLFLAYAGLGAVSQALSLWEDLKGSVDDPVARNLAAETLVKAGDRGEAIRLYTASLAMDPRQEPVRRRLAELESPTGCDRSLLASRRINLYFYSYNKAGSLRETLQGLAGCEIGAARIKVLLNGCTDDSQAVVAQARHLFPENAFDVISLPVNVGAPAARNWLIASPETAEADYTAFLDDDVTVQPDFLHHFLRVAETTDRFGVVGCKIVFPGEVARYQYLYRNIAVAKPGLLRISLDTPNNQFDIGTYDFTRETDNVMGCCHLFSRQALADAPAFDLGFSPSQMDDIAHDIDLRLLGYKVVYCGLVRCEHRQLTGNARGADFSSRKLGNLLGNDVKFYYRFRDSLDRLRELGSVS